MNLPAPAADCRRPVVLDDDDAHAVPAGDRAPCARASRRRCIYEDDETKLSGSNASGPDDDDSLDASAANAQAADGTWLTDDHTSSPTASPPPAAKTPASLPPSRPPASAPAPPCRRRPRARVA